MRRALLALLLVLACAPAALSQQFPPPNIPLAPGGRLTLASGQPVYQPTQATPNSTDTGAETVSFAANHGWVSGTLATPSATAGGLTAGTAYWLCVVDGDTASFHTSLANALACSSPVNLTASITAQVRPYGVQATTLRWTCLAEAVAGPTGAGCWVSLYTGATANTGHWESIKVPSELSLALTMTADSNYSIYLARCGVTVCLELGTVWSGNNTPEALASQDGMPVKSSDYRRLYVGLGRAVATDTMEDSFGATISQVGARRFLANAFHQREVSVGVFDGASSYTYQTVAFRQTNGAAGNKVEAVFATPGAISLAAGILAQVNTALNTAWTTIGQNSTTLSMFHCVHTLNYSQNANASFGNVALCVSRDVAPGYHAFNWLEIAGSTNTTTWFPSNTTPGNTTSRIQGLSGWVRQ